MLIREMPETFQPEYRAKLLGFGSLTDYELVQLVYSFKDLETSQQLLAKAVTLRELAKFSLEEMQTVDGIGPKAALAIKAALELGRRMGVEEIDRDLPLLTPERVYNRLRYLEGMSQEHLVVILLDTKLRPLGVETIHIGSVDSSLVRVAEVFRPAVRRNATSLVVGHNHPSGDPTPSPADVTTTTDLIEAGKLLGIQVQDHLIVGLNRFYSMREKGMCFDVS